jgi:hypothetical protein
MRTTAEIVRESVNRAMIDVMKDAMPEESPPQFIHRFATIAATYACEMAQADAAALLKSVTMRATDGGTRRDD